jgi:hypothetical protein
MEAQYYLVFHYKNVITVIRFRLRRLFQSSSPKVHKTGSTFNKASL